MSGAVTCNPLDMKLGRKLLLVFSVLLTGFAPANAGEEILIDEILHVRNGVTPSQGVGTLHLREVWRVGGPEDEETLLGLVSDVCGDEDGNVYVLDAQLCQVHVYAQDGQLLRTLFRQGEGPGETQSPRGMVMMSDGSVGLVQEFPGKIVMVDRQGVPQGSITPGSDDPTQGGWTSLTMASCRDGNLILTGGRPLPNDRPNTQLRSYFLASFNPEGKELVQYLEEQHLRDYSDFVLSERRDTPAFWWASAVGPGGSVYTTPDRDRYTISVFKADGTLERVIEREYELRKRTPSEIERIRLLYEIAVSGISIPYTLDI